MGRVRVSKAYANARNNRMTEILEGDNRVGRTAYAGLIVADGDSRPPVLGLSLEALAEIARTQVERFARAAGVDAVFEGFADKRGSLYHVRAGERTSTIDARCKPAAFREALRAFALPAA